MYFLANKQGKYLSQFTPNDLTGKSQLSFRKNDYYFYDTLKEAEDHLRFILSYSIGERNYKQAANLKIIESSE